VNIGR